MRFVACGCLALGMWLLSTTPTSACSVTGVPKTTELLGRSDAIVVAIARELISPRTVQKSTFIRDDRRVRFDIVETLKGAIGSTQLIIPGRTSDRDDFNDAPLGANSVRREGDAECFARSYRLGATYLLLLIRTGDGAWTPYWSALSRVNDQVHPNGDRWVEWVRRRVR